MTEEDWVSSVDPRPMLELLRSKGSERQFRLFAVACCQSIRSILTDYRSVDGIAAAELLADAQCSHNDFRTAQTEAHTASVEAGRQFENPWSPRARMVDFAARAASETMNLSAVWQYATSAFLAASHTADCVATARKFTPLGLGGRAGRTLSRKERRIQAALLRCIFGNPFRPVAFDPRWRTSDVVGLARAIYDDKAFERMPILADAIMDAGCEDEQISSHCRGDGPHVRGCWVVDLVLGKS